jgi:creatinine amidohydrolase
MEYLIPTQTTDDSLRSQARTAILPIGSFEQHGPYLPLSTDTLIACVISNTISNSYAVQHLPPITITCSHEHSSWPGTVSISASTLYSVIFDIHKSLQQSGVPNLVLISAHGGNYVLRNIVQEATIAAPCMSLFPTNEDWASARATAGLMTTDHEDMHAGELETSILLYAVSDLVRPGYITGDHVANERSALLTLGMKAYSASGIIGRPSLASAAKGKELLASFVTSFADCLAQLS